MFGRPSSWAARAFLLAALLLLARSPVSAAPQWMYATQWGGGGTSNGQFLGPWGVAVDASGDVYVSDENNSSVQKFTRTGVYILRWGSYGSGNGQFHYYASGVAIARNGDVYVVDTANHRVQKFTGNGVYLLQWGTPGSGNGQFTYPGSVTVDRDDNVYVTDNGNNRIQKFDSGGNFLLKWGSSGSGDGELSNPWSVASDHAGNVYVSDYGNNRVQKFTSSGTYLRQWGVEGTGPSEFRQPTGIAVDGADRVYVSDVLNDRVQRFTSDSTYLDEFGSSGSGNGQLHGPYSLAVSAQGDVYVADRNGQRVQVFVFGSPPAIASIRDVPNDQGRAVRLRLQASSLDAAHYAGAAAVVRYDVFRRNDLASATRVAPAAARSARPAAAQIAGWDFVASLPAYGENAYDLVVPTVADSNASGLHRSAFFVRGASECVGIHVDSAPDSGWSVDNLSPPAPAPFTATYAGGATHLHWGVSGASDFAAFRLYRGTTPDFSPSPGTLIATLTDTGHVDVGPAGRYFKLSAVDFNGNEGAVATLGPVRAADAPGPAAPQLALAGARPNPARTGRLTVHFTLPDATPATLELLDPAGRRLATRAVGELGAGEHVVDLARGLALRPGLYLLRLTRGDRAISTRLAVLD